MSVSRDFTTPDGRGYRALDDITLSIDAGAFVAIVGPSGCGKSTLLNIVAGLLPPSAGTVRVAGESLAGLNQRATYMFQQDALLPWKTVRENVGLGLTLAGIAQARGACARGRWLARVGLAAFADHYPAQLSGGMRKRVAMAQNWIIDRDILLMDEPFSALDVHTRQQMETELLELWEPGRPPANPSKTVCSSPTISKKRSRSPRSRRAVGRTGARTSSRATGDARRGRAIYGAAHDAGVHRAVPRDLGRSCAKK